MGEKRIVRSSSETFGTSFSTISCEKLPNILSRNARGKCAANAEKGKGIRGKGRQIIFSSDGKGVKSGRQTAK